ncbi:hypothetical protein NMG60_11034583 [Bertholletia excelsa]
MGDVPSLITLCVKAIKKEILCGEDISPDLYELPSHLFDCLLTHLPPLALQKLQEQIPFEYSEETSNDCCDQRKRKRLESRFFNFDREWRKLYESQWPVLARQDCVVDWLAKGVNHKFAIDWQQMFWETHLQKCLDKVSEIALLPSFDGCISQMRIPDVLLKPIGYEAQLNSSTYDYSKLAYQLQQFGSYVRHLRLQNVFCIAETCHLLRKCRLQSLVVRWIKSKEHVEGLCKLLNQNIETLKSIEFIHCKLSSDFLNAICKSLCKEETEVHAIEHFSIKASSFLETRQSSCPIGLAYFLSSGRSLSSLNLSDNHFGQNFGKLAVSSLLVAVSGISILDLSEKNISGLLSRHKWRFSCCSQLSSGIGNSLMSLRVLSLRGNNLCKDDAESLKYALMYMPNLETLDISDNPLEDEGIKSLIPCLLEMSEKDSHITVLKLENCELSCNGLSQLLGALSTFKRPLDFLSIGGNELGNKVGPTLVKYLGTGIRALDIENIGLGSYGFLELRKEMREDLKLVYINISKNRGGIETAKFLTTLIPLAPELVAVNAGYNIMPFKALSTMCSALKAAKGRLQHVDLTGNNWNGQSADASMLAEFQINGKPILVLPTTHVSNVPYDDDP